MVKGFASTGDLSEKKVSFDELAPGIFAFTAEGDPNSGVVIGDQSVLVFDAQATPKQARRVIERVRQVTDKPITHLVLSHYHAVRVMGASAYAAAEIICSLGTYELICERGQQDFESEVGRFPRLFEDVASVPGLTYPTMAFERRLVLWLGRRKVELLFLGRGHTAGDIVAWMPDEKVLFAGDLVEYGATPYTGDAHLREWPQTLDAVSALGAEKLVPGRGAAARTAKEVQEAIAGTRAFLADLYAIASEGVARGWSLKQVYDQAMARMEPTYGGWAIFHHCMPFDVSRAFDEASGMDWPRIWTHERDLEMWRQLAGG
ncbi:Metallo-beta-lactamase type 2 [bacterium HR40]|nr:Metallo-beta-lactamase type 2 [bacterium HR40]